MIKHSKAVFIGFHVHKALRNSKQSTCKSKVRSATNINQIEKSSRFILTLVNSNSYGIRLWCVKITKHTTPIRTSICWTSCLSLVKACFILTKGPTRGKIKRLKKCSFLLSLTTYIFVPLWSKAVYLEMAPVI